MFDSKKTLGLFAGLVVAMAAVPASAALIASESFDYSADVGTSVTGLNGGTGWDAAYAATGPVALADGLTHGLIGSSSTKAMRYTAQGTLSNGGRSYVGTPAAGDTYWYSFLVKPELGARGTLNPLMASNNNQNGLGLRIDVTGTPTDSITQFKAWTVTQNSGPNVVFTNAFGSTFLIVGKADLLANGTSTNQIWVFANGEIPLDEAALASVTNTSSVIEASTANTALLVSGWGGRAFGNQGGFPSNNIVYDELNIGTTFGSVVPVIPEPAALGLLVPAAVLVRRRSR